jgi:nitrate/nitrite transporter NarK
METSMAKAGIPREYSSEHAGTKLSDIKNFKRTYWMLLLVMMCLYGSIFPFLSFGSNFLQMKFAYTEQEAGRLVGAVSIISMVLSPILGYFIDIFGKRIHFGKLSILFILLS